VIYMSIMSFQPLRIWTEEKKCEHIRKKQQKIRKKERVST
jgi:hypothetical protein